MGMVLRGMRRVLFGRGSWPERSEGLDLAINPFWRLCEMLDIFGLYEVQCRRGFL